MSEPRSVTRHPVADIDDEALDGWIRARLQLLGVDLSVLPVDDTSAPVDQRRIFESARRFLRGTLPALADFDLDEQQVVPLTVPGSGGWTAFYDPYAPRSGEGA